MKDHSTKDVWSWILKRLRKAVENGEAVGEAYWERLQEELIEWEQVTAPEAKELIETVQRDWLTVRQIAGEVQQLLADWLRSEAQVMESYLEDWVALAADHAEVDWWFLQKKWQEANKRKTGQQVSMGIYQCDACGQRVHIRKPGRLPPCPKCGGVNFTLWIGENEKKV